MIRVVFLCVNEVGLHMPGRVRRSVAFVGSLGLMILAVSRTSAVDDGAAPAVDDAIDFERQIRPILTSRCLKCHGADAPRGDLNLTSRAHALEAGAIVPGKLEDSALLERVSSHDASIRMPPEGDPLTAEQIELLQRWISAGAEWPGHWAYQPVHSPNVQELKTSALHDWCRTPVDRFIAARLEREGLTPSPEADRLTLLRRVSFDVRGLPPTPEEVEEFLNDQSPDAWERCVDRLLASPHYGERWARHWMDLVHFAETHGHDQDRPREHAWPYRDYLIRAFNSDKPYERFIAEQIAGDVLFPGDPDALVATGFLAAGPWDESSLRDIREDAIDRLIGQYLDRDDIVTTVMSTVTSTSIHCARCHDHKFDPISQAEYYGLQAVFAGVDKANRAFDSDPRVAARRDELDAEQVRLTERFQTAPEQLAVELSADELARWEREVRATSIVWRPLDVTAVLSVEGGMLTRLEDGSYLASGIRPEKDVYRIDGTTDLQRVTAIQLEVLDDDSLPMRGPGRQDNGNLHLNEIRVWRLPAESGEPVELPLGMPQADFNQQGWTIAAAVDRNPATAWGIFPEVGKPHRVVFPLAAPADRGAFRIELEQSHGGGHLIGRFRLSVTDAAPDVLERNQDVPIDIAELLALERERRSPAQSAKLAFWLLNRAIERERAALPPRQFVYAGTPEFAPEGSFRPATTPRTVHVLKRGLIDQPETEAIPQALACLESLPATFSLDDPGREGTRRRALADWLVDRRNPLTWRSIANRVWLHHFGRGLVDTPNDFGQMGASPTHPELLDWLAARLQQQGGSLKSLHKEILLSATYRQSSESRAETAARDADNRWLWRAHRRRLDAESFRDALLVASGTLDARMEGPSERQFLQTPGIHVTPNVDYANFDVDHPANYRRSVYRFLFRTIPDPFMEALDCPDASQLTPQRNVSLTSLQALATLNDKFVVRQSERLAARLEAEHTATHDRIVAAYRRLFGRVPADDELAAVTEYADRHGLANACRFLFNTNEFLFLD